MYKVSVIVPVYNTEPYLEECLNSILNQTLKEFQIILVDDGSLDNAGNICDKYAQIYDNVAVIHKENEGLGLARNSGLSLAQGEYIAFIDSDDKIKEDYLETLYYKACFNNADVCFSGGFINFDKNTAKPINFNFKNDFIINEKNDIYEAASKTIGRKLQKNDSLPCSSCMALYKKQFLDAKNLKFISERIFISEDLWFNIDCIINSTKIVYTKYYGYCYRYNQLSLSRCYNPQRFEKLSSSIEMLIKKCESIGLNDYYERVAMAFWVNFEKCINQELRYKKGLNLDSIKSMCDNDISKQILEYLYNKKIPGAMHNFLGNLLYKQHFLLAACLLKTYNIFAHYKNA